MNDWAHQGPGQGSEAADAMGQGREGAAVGPGPQVSPASGQQVGGPGYRGPDQAPGAAPSGMYGPGAQVPGCDAHGVPVGPGAVQGAPQGGPQGFGQPAGVHPDASLGGGDAGVAPGYQSGAYYGHQAPPFPPFPGQYQPAMGYPPPYHPYPPYAYPPYAYPPHGQAPQAAPTGGPGGVSDLMEELANGGNGLSSLTKMLSLDDSEFWKGALVGAAAVLLLTNESVQGALFKAGARSSDAVKSGIDRVKGATGEDPADD